MLRSPRLTAVRVLIGILCCFSPFIGLCQSLNNWTIDQPSQALQIVSVEHLTIRADRLTLKNISHKAITSVMIVSSVSQTDRTTQTINSFAASGVIAPGAEAKTIVNLRDDASRGEMPEAHVLHVSAILYADGSSEGTKQGIDSIESEDFGFALEIKRDADLLAACLSSGNASAADLEELTKKIENPAAEPGNEFAASVRAITHGMGNSKWITLEGGDSEDAMRVAALPGVSQKYVDTVLGHNATEDDCGTRPARNGVYNARVAVLRDLDSVWLNLDSASLSAQAQRARAAHIMPSTLSAISQKYTALSAKQILIIQQRAARMSQ